MWKAEKLLGISGENGGQVAALFTHCTSAVDGARVRRSVVNRLYERVFNNLVAHINQQLKVKINERKNDRTKFEGAVT